MVFNTLWTNHENAIIASAKAPDSIDTLVGSIAVGALTFGLLSAIGTLNGRASTDKGLKSLAAMAAWLTLTIETPERIAAFFKYCNYQIRNL